MKNNNNVTVKIHGKFDHVNNEYYDSIYIQDDPGRSGGIIVGIGDAPSIETRVDA